MSEKVSEMAEQMKDVYKYYFDNGGNPELALKKVDRFLSSYGDYAEALVFKSRMLLASNQNSLAKKSICRAMKLDPWRLNGIFDRAEVEYFEQGVDKASKVALGGVSKYLDELEEGIHGFMLSLDEEDREKVGLEIQEHVQKKVKNILASCMG